MDDQDIALLTELLDKDVETAEVLFSFFSLEKIVLIYIYLLFDVRNCAIKLLNWRKERVQLLLS